MNIVVCVKQVFDTEAKIKLDSSGKIDKSGVNLIMNPYDEFAVEEALRLKEKNGGEVIILSLGSDTPEAIRQALAMGADRAISLEDPAFTSGDAHTVALALAKALEGVQFDLILGGWAAIDDNASQVPSRLAEIMNLPQVNVVTKLEIADGKAVCHRQGDAGTEIIEVPLPAVITAQKGLNEVRYPSLKGIMAAKKKELKQVKAADLGLNPEALTGYTEITAYFLPEARKAGKIIEGELPDTAKELVRLLREEAKVI